MNQDTVQLDEEQPGAARPGARARHRARRGPAVGGRRRTCEHAEAGLSVLLEAWQRAIEELGAMLPPAQVRALLAIEAGTGLNVTGLARTLGTSPSATSRLCDRLVTAGLLARVPAAASRREILLAADRVRPAAGRLDPGSAAGRADPGAGVAQPGRAGGPGPRAQRAALRSGERRGPRRPQAPRPALR